MKLDRLDHFPPALQSIGPREILSVFPNPTLIALPGQRGDPVFLSALLHGNETTSFYVLQALAARYAATSPPRGLMVFVGNVRATAAGERFLPDQPDFNRIWRDHAGEAGALADEVMAAARAASPFASLDIHNNTGANPIYGCVASLRPADLHLAAMVGPVGVYYHNPNTTQSIAFSAFCPALTVECGQNGDQQGLAKALALVEQTLRLEELPTHPPAPEALRVLETVGRVLIDPRRSFSFGDGGADIVFRPDLEQLNFRDLPAGASWTLGPIDPMSLRVVNEHGDDLTDGFFAFEATGLRLRRPVTPSMITRNERAVRQDCLCYLMAPLP